MAFPDNVSTDQDVNIAEYISACEIKILKPLAALVKEESTSMIVELQNNFSELHANMVECVKAFGKKYRHRSFTVVYQLQLWDRWSRIQEIMEVMSWSFAVIPYLLDKICTRNFDLHALSPEESMIAVVRSLYNTILHSISSLRLIVIQSISVCQRLGCCIQQGKQLLSELVPSAVDTARIQFNHTLRVELPHILDELWQFKQVMVTHLKHDLPWYSLQTPWESERKHPIQLMLSLRNMRWQHSLITDFHLICDGADGCNIRSISDCLLWLSDLYRHCYSVMAIGTAHSDVIIAMIDKMIAIINQALIIQFNRPKAVTDVGLSLMHSVYSLCTLGISRWLYVAFVKLSSDEELLQCVQVIQSMVSIAQTACRYPLKALSQPAKDISERLCDGIMLGYYLRTNATSRVEEMIINNYKVVVDCICKFITATHTGVLPLFRKIAQLSSSVVDAIDIVSFGISDNYVFPEEVFVILQLVCAHCIQCLVRVTKGLVSENIDAHFVLGDENLHLMVILCDQWNSLRTLSAATTDPHCMLKLRLLKVQIYYLFVSNLHNSPLTLHNNPIEYGPFSTFYSGVETYWKPFEPFFAFLPTLSECQINSLHARDVNVINHHLWWLEMQLITYMLVHDALVCISTLSSSTISLNTLELHHLYTSVFQIFNPCFISLHNPSNRTNPFIAYHVSPLAKSYLGYHLPHWLAYLHTMSVASLFPQWCDMFDHHFYQAIINWKNEISTIVVSR